MILDTGQIQPLVREGTYNNDRKRQTFQLAISCHKFRRGFDSKTDRFIDCHLASGLGLPTLRHSNEL
jgi:hypothetical protein